MTLAREGKQQDWLQNFTMPHRAYVGLEQGARSLKNFQSAVVPGILQVADYTRALHRVVVPPVADESIEERVGERHTRQQILTGENAPQVEIILDEAVIRRPLGGPLVMREQLDHLIKMQERPNVSIRVVPYTVGAHPALESNFTILSFDGLAPTTIHAEGLAGQIYLERQQDVERYQNVFDLLRTMALSPKDTALLIEKARDSYTSELTLRRRLAAVRRTSPKPAR